jgi:hypothetical protein
MKITDNHEARIWLGLREGYTENFYKFSEVSSFIRDWCGERGQCVSLTRTEYIYVHGQEPGLIIGFINYPRYPLSAAEIRNRAMELGEKLMKHFKQYRISITVYPTIPAGTIMLENEELSETHK